MKRIYLAGPMSGIPEFNFPAFKTWAAILRDLGHIVFSPAEADIRRYGRDISAGNLFGNSQIGIAAEVGLNIRDCLAEDMAWICGNAEAIALMPGWEASKGARAEHALAAALGLEFIYL